MNVISFKKGCVFTVMMSAFMLFNVLPLFASDMSDAKALRERCEADVKSIEILVKNFGNDTVVKDYNTALEMIKNAKVKFAQSKYPEAIAIYNDYLKLQTYMYKGLASDYITRTETIFNDTATDLVDFIENEKVSKYLSMANQYISDAKKAVSIDNQKLAIENCRSSKKYSFECYKAAGKQLPEKYSRDVKDNNKEIAQ